MKKTISAFGHDTLAIAFNMGVQLVYEDITGKAFELTDLTTTRLRISLYYAVIVFNNPEITLELSDMLSIGTPEDFATIDSAILDCMKNWYHIPEVMEEKEERKTDDEEKKN